MSTTNTEPSQQAGGLLTRFRPKARPAIYVVVILAVVVVAFALKMRRDGIFACPASAYSDDRFLAYCEANAYGDFDHGAAWFGLDPTYATSATTADVLFVGNSRLQFGLSAPALGRWFADVGRRYYLLGFSHGENSTFYAPLLERLRPQARAYVISVDGFFADTPTAPARDVMNGSADTRSRYKAKRNWQLPHRIICNRVGRLCGNNVSFYRHRDTGEWRRAGSRGLVPSDIGPVLPVDTERVARERVIAERFIAGLGVPRECVFLTYIPNNKTNDSASAAALASALGFDLMLPEVDGLRTFDGSHLDPESAERFASAMLEIAGPPLRKCLSGQAARTPQSGPVAAATDDGEARS